MDMICSMLLEPQLKFFKSFLVVGKDLVFEFAIDQQCYVKLSFCNINTEYSF